MCNWSGDKNCSNAELPIVPTPHQSESPEKVCSPGVHREIASERLGHSTVGQLKTGSVDGCSPLFAQLIEQDLSFLQIGCTDRLREPAVDGCEEIASLAAPVFIVPQSGEACGSAQLPMSSLLTASECEGFHQICLGSGEITTPPSQLSAHPM